jgi:hypothetical protein
MSNATEPVTFADLLHTARAYMAAVHAPESIPPRYKQLAAWHALPTLERAGYDHDRIWQHLRTLEALADLAATRKADRKHAAAFMDALLPALEERRRSHGWAYVTYRESHELIRHDLRQPGHTKYRYSTPGEDLSDAAQLTHDDEEPRS